MEICGVKTTFIQKKKNKKMFFLGSKYSKIAFA